MASICHTTIWMAAITQHTKYNSTTYLKKNHSTDLRFSHVTKNDKTQVKHCSTHQIKLYNTYSVAHLNTSTRMLLCVQPTDWNVTQHSPWFVIHSPADTLWQMKKVSGVDQSPLKYNKPARYVAFDFSINISLMLYLSFALIRQKISEQVSCNTCLLKTEAHYILWVSALECLLLIHCCKLIFFPGKQCPMAFYPCLIVPAMFHSLGKNVCTLAILDKSLNKHLTNTNNMELNALNSVNSLRLDSQEKSRMRSFFKHKGRRTGTLLLYF